MSDQIFINKTEESTVNSIQNTDYTIIDTYNSTDAIYYTRKISLQSIKSIVQPQIISPASNKFSELQTKLTNLQTLINKKLDKTGTNFNSNEKIIGGLSINSTLSVIDYNSTFNKNIVLRYNTINNLSVITPIDDYDGINKIYVDDRFSSLPAQNLNINLYLNKTGDTMSDSLILANNPSNNNHAATKQYTDNVFSNNNIYVHLSGDENINGSFIVQTPINSLNPATKIYTDTRFENNTFLKKSGGSLTKALSVLDLDINSLNYIVNLNYVTSAYNIIKDLLPLVGGVLQNALSVLNPNTSSEIANKEYVDNNITSSNNPLLPISGGNLTFNLSTNGSPRNSTELANKLYVDNIFNNLNFVRLAGNDRITGQLFVQSPNDNEHIVTKKYIDDISSKQIVYIKDTGGSLERPIYVPELNNDTNSNIIATLAYVTSAYNIIKDILPLVGGTLQNALSVLNPNTSSEIANKEYVDNNITSSNNPLLPISGGNLTFNLSTNGSPRNSTELANKLYVDNIFNNLNFVRLAGNDRITGQLFVQSPNDNEHIVTKKYIDDISSKQVLYIKDTGGALERPIYVPELNSNSNANVVATLAYVTSAFNVIKDLLPLVGGTLQNALSVRTPNTNSEIANKQYVDNKIDLSNLLPLSGSSQLRTVSANNSPKTSSELANKLYVDNFFNNLSFVRLAGNDNITGPIFIQNPITNQHIVSKKYVDDSAKSIDSYLRKTGGLLDSPIYVPFLSANSNANIVATLAYVTSAFNVIKDLLPLDGGTLQRALSVRTTNSDSEIATKLYVDNRYRFANVLFISGGSITGRISASNPNTPKEIATKGYVDTYISTLSYVPTAGNCEVTGELFVQTPTLNQQVATKKYVDERTSTTITSRYLTRSGGNLLNPINVQAIATTTNNPSCIISRQYCIDKMNAITERFLPLSGNATITGSLSITDPINRSDVVNKRYTDSILRFPSLYIPLTGTNLISGRLSSLEPISDKDVVTKNYTDITLIKLNYVNRTENSKLSGLVGDTIVEPCSSFNHSRDSVLNIDFNNTGVYYINVRKLIQGFNFINIDTSVVKTFTFVFKSDIKSPYSGSETVAGTTNNTDIESARYTSLGHITNYDNRGYCVIDGHAIKTIYKDLNNVLTWAGSVTAAGNTNINYDGPKARFNNPKSLVDDGGDIYVADSGNHTIRLIDRITSVTTFAGVMGSSGHVDGAKATAKFNSPYGIVRDSSGNFYISDTNNNCIRKINTSNIVSTIAGHPLNIAKNFDGIGTDASFLNPTQMVIDSANNLFVHSSGVIRKINTTTNQVTTLYRILPVSRALNISLTIDSENNLYFSYYKGIRKISPTGDISVIYFIKDNMFLKYGINGIYYDNSENVLMITQGTAIYKVYPSSDNSFINWFVNKRRVLFANEDAYIPDTIEGTRIVTLISCNSTWYGIDGGQGYGLAGLLGS